MTDDFTHDTSPLTEISDRIAKAQEIATGARNRARANDVHEANADMVYLHAYNLALMELPCGCSLCKPSSKRPRWELFWVVSALAWLIIAVYSIVTYLSDHRYGLAVVWSLTGLMWIAIGGMHLRRWWRP